MVDEVKITAIDDNVVNKVNWAKDSTLQRLIDRTDQQTDLLEKIAGIRRKEIQQDRRQAEATKSKTKADEEAAEATEKLADAIEKAEKEQSKERQERYLARLEQEKHTKGVRNLRESMSQLERVGIASVFEGVTDKVALFGGQLSEKTGKMRALGMAMTALSRAMVAGSFAFGAFRAGLDPFRQMLDSGIAFGGSIEEMQVQVGRTGLGLQEFTRIALANSQQISGIGDRAFAGLVRGVQDITRQFGRYGQSVEAQAESIGAFLDILSSGGSLYRMTEEQRTRATVEYLREQTALTRLTGISRKRLEDEQKQLMAQANVDLAIREMEARGDVRGAAQMRMMLQQMTAVMGPELASALTGMQMGIAPQDPAVRRLLAVSGTMDTLQQMSAQMMTMTPEQARAQALAMRGQMATPDAIRLMRIGAEIPGSALAGAAQLGSRILRRTDVAATRTPAQVREAEDISAGIRGVLDPATTALEQITGDIARITGDLRSTIFTITQQLGIFSAALPAVAGATGGATGISSGLAAASGTGLGAGAIAAALGGGFLIKSLMTARTLGTIARFVAPLTPSLASLGAGAGAGLSAATAGGLSAASKAMAGRVPVVGGLITGGVSYAQDGNLLRSLFVGGGTALGALGGGALGAGAGLGVGALPGAIAGSMAGQAAGGALYDMIFGAAQGGGQAAPLSPVAAPDFAASMSRLDNSIVRHLGPESDIVKNLQELIDISQRNESNTARIAAAF